MSVLIFRFNRHRTEDAVARPGAEGVGDGLQAIRRNRNRELILPRRHLLRHRIARCDIVLRVEPLDDRLVLPVVPVLLEVIHQPVRAIHDRHVFGIFPRETWLRLLREVGFEPRAVPDPWGREVFIGRK